MVSGASDTFARRENMSNGEEIAAGLILSAVLFAYLAPVLGRLLS